jgi:hypothetical protein
VEVIRLDLPRMPIPDATQKTVVDTTPRPVPGATPKTMVASAGDRRRPATRRAKTPSKTPLLVALGAVSLVVAITIIVFPKGDGAAKKSTGENPTGKSPKADPLESREAKAEKAFAKVDELSRMPGTSPEDRLAAIERARPDCRGTPFESKLEDLRKSAQREKEEAEAAKLLQPLLDKLLKDVASDPKFTRYAELEEKFRQAKELALKSGSAKLAEVTELRRVYTHRYEMAAEPYGREIGEAAQILLDEKRYDDAMAKIETFPRELRQSGAWRGVERIRQEIERQKKLFPPKK